MIADDTIPLCLDRRTEHVVRRRLAVRTADDEDILLHLACKLLKDGGADPKRDLPRPRHTLPMEDMDTGFFSNFRCPDGQHSA